MDREERLRRKRDNIVLDGTEKLQKEQRLEARSARERRQHAMMSTEQQQMLLQWRREAIDIVLN